MASDVGVAPALERLLDEFLPVEPREIEAAFDRIWQEASSGAYDTSSVRLRVSNFIVWGAEGDAAGRFDRVMETLAQRHPCRAILAMTAGDAGPLRSSISAHCWRTALGGRHICSEEILLRGRLGGEHEIASAVLGLMVSELPVHLWLAGAPDPVRYMPEELVELADRLYVDSAAAPSTPAALRELAGGLGDLDAVVVDLAWERATAWRELAAQFFDSHATASQLDRLAAIEIVGGDGQPSSAALLTAGWLAASLEMSPASVSASDAQLEATYYDGTRGVQLKVAPSPLAIELERVALRTGDAAFTIEVHEPSGHMHVRSDFASEPVHRTVARDRDDDASVLTAAIEDTTAQDVYEAALRAAVELLDT